MLVAVHTGTVTLKSKNRMDVQKVEMEEGERRLRIQRERFSFFQMRRKNAEAGGETKRRGGRREEGKSEGTGTARRLC